MVNAYISANGSAWTSLGYVLTWKSDKQATLDVMTMSLGNSNEAFADDYEGAKRTITITVKSKVADVAARKAQIISYENLINGNQSVPYYFYVEDTIGTSVVPIRCKFESLSVSGASGDPNTVAASFNILECAV